MAYKTDILDFTIYEDIFLGMDFERIYDEYPGGAGSSVESAKVMAPLRGGFALVDSKEIFYFIAATKAA